MLISDLRSQISDLRSQINWVDDERVVQDMG